MPRWSELLKSDSLSWLLEPDIENTAVRYLTLRDIIGSPPDSPELLEAKAAAMATGTIAAVLDRQRPAGYWVKPGGGYGPKYTGTVWSLTLLAQMGADKSELRVRKAATYVLENTITPQGWFSYNGTPSGFLHCHAGYLGDAMYSLGFGDDPRVEEAVTMQARIVTGEGIADKGSEDSVRFYHYTPGPNFVCNKLPCTWGAVKALKAIASVSEHRRNQTMISAIERGKELFFNTDLTVCKFSNLEKGKPSGNWFRFGFPMLYVGDVLEVLEVMTRLGEGRRPHFENAWKLVLDKQDDRGRWRMEHSYNGKLWSDIEEKCKPSKWVTLRALRALKTAFPG